MSCNCDIRSTVERLEAQGLIRGDRAPLSVLLADIDKADKDSFLFTDHMQVEEDLIFPFLAPTDRNELLIEHAIIRNFRARGLPVPFQVFEAHRNREKVLFSMLGKS